MFADWPAVIYCYFVWHCELLRAGTIFVLVCGFQMPSTATLMWEMLSKWSERKSRWVIGFCLFVCVCMCMFSFWSHASYTRHFECLYRSVLSNRIFFGSGTILYLCSPIVIVTRHVWPLSIWNVVKLRAWIYLYLVLIIK